MNTHDTTHDVPPSQPATGNPITGLGPVTRARPIAGLYKDNLADLIGRLAATGQDDPSIAHRLGITVSQVRRLRAEFEIPAGERRWLPVHAAADTGHPDQPVCREKGQM